MRGHQREREREASSSERGRLTILVTPTSPPERDRADASDDGETSTVDDGELVLEALVSEVGVGGSVGGEQTIGGPS